MGKDGKRSTTDVVSNQWLGEWAKESLKSVFCLNWEYVMLCVGYLTCSDILLLSSVCLLLMIIHDHYEWWTNLVQAVVPVDIYQINFQY